MESVLVLVLLSLVVASLTWTFTHEEIFREPREWLTKKSEASHQWWVRKFFFMWTCEFCLSHCVAAVVIGLMSFRLLMNDWRGVLVALFTVVAVANIFMSAFAQLRIKLGTERIHFPPR